MTLKKARQQVSDWTDDLDIEDILLGAFLVVCIIAGIFAGPTSCSLRVESHDTTTTTVSAR